MLASATAQEKNADGFRLLQQKSYREAAEAFAEAEKLDDKYAVAHYNRSCTLALARAHGQVCDADAYKPTILQELSRALALDPAHIEKAKNDADLAAVHDTLGWHRLVLKRDIKRDDDVRAILPGVGWYGPVPGAVMLSRISFKKDGTLLYESGFAEGAPKKQAGAWAVQNGKLTLTIGKKTWPAVLTWEALDVPGLDHFTDDPDDCDA